METNNMSNIAVQGGSGLHTGYASSLKLQRLYVSRGSERGCCCSQSKRCKTRVPSVAYRY